MIKSGMLFAEEPRYMTNAQVLSSYSSTPTSNLDIESIIEEKLKKLNNTIMQCKCNNCGAPLSVDYNKPIIVCKYCNSTYIMGNARINDRY